MMNKALLGAFAVGFLLAVGCGSPPPPSSPDPAITGAGGTEKDTDNDGVPDGLDKCPDKKEDGLGALPKDGCPDPGAGSNAPPGAAPTVPAKPKP